MDATAPLLSPLLPVQLFLAAARALGQSSRALELALKRMSSKHAMASVFAGYRPGAHDVFVTCFSKSGTNWTMQMAVQLAHRGAAEFEHIHHLVPWPDAPLFPGVIPLDDPGPRQRAPTGLRAIKTALPAAYVPYSPDARYLCVARDPKEIVVSAYYFVTSTFGLRAHISPEQWLELSLKPTSMISMWPEHMASYWSWRDRPNVLVLMFPEMKRDLAGTVDRVARHLGVTLDADQRAAVIHKCSFAYMKSKQSCFAPPRMPLLTGRARGEMIRSGKTGDLDFITPKLRAQLDEMMLARLRELGSDFPYRELFMANG